MEFMEKYPDIARGFTKRDKPTVDSLWKTLAESLNGAGLPHKDVNGWKKTWTEWKSDIKRKLAKNKAESRATGGGPFSKYQLTHTEETIVRICGIAIGLSEDVGGEGEDVMPSTSSKRPMSPLVIGSTPKRPKTESTGERLKKFLDEDIERKVEINEKLEELIKTEKENTSSLRRVYRAIEKGNESVANAVIELKNQFVRFTTSILQAMQDKNEVEKKQLDLELLKFDYQKSKEK